MERQLQEVMGQAANGTPRRPGRRRSHSQGAALALPSTSDPEAAPSSEDLGGPKAAPSDTGAGPLDRSPPAASRVHPAQVAPEPPLPAAGPQAGEGASTPPLASAQLEPLEGPQAVLASAPCGEGEGGSGGRPVLTEGGDPKALLPGHRLCPQCSDCASSWLGYAAALFGLLASGAWLAACSLTAPPPLFSPCARLAPGSEHRTRKGCLLWGVVQGPSGGASGGVRPGGSGLPDHSLLQPRPRPAAWLHHSGLEGSPAAQPRTLAQSPTKHQGECQQGSTLDLASMGMGLAPLLLNRTASAGTTRRLSHSRLPRGMFG